MPQSSSAAGGFPSVNLVLPTSSSQSVSQTPDIGIILNLHSLQQDVKLELVTQAPDASYKYPSTYMHGCNRRFKPELTSSMVILQLVQGWCVLQSLCLVCSE